MKEWKRHCYVTGGADPTVVVQWGNGKIFIEEFQGVYRVAQGRRSGPVVSDNPIADILGAALHQALEKIEQETLEQNDENNANYDLDRIYGGE